MLYFFINARKALTLFIFLNGIVLPSSALAEPSQTDELKFNNLLVLGIIGNFDRNYKIDIFKKLRPHAKNIYVGDIIENAPAHLFLPDEFDHPFLANGLADHFIPVESLETTSAYQEICNHLTKNKIKIDAVVTYCEEWLQVSTLIAEHYSLPHPSIQAHYNSQNKQATKEILTKANIESPKYSIASIKDIVAVGIEFGFPLFIKPIKETRSEWGRWISNQKDLEDYSRELKSLYRYENETFILEEAIEGHEVDVDLVLYENKLLYVEVSDKFPIHEPFALETGHLMPSILDHKTQATLIDHAGKAVKAYGYDCGVIHVELIVRPDGKIYLLEVNGNLGGMDIAKWHEKIWGVDLVKAELAIAGGLNPRIFLNKKNPDQDFSMERRIAHRSDYLKRSKQKREEPLNYEARFKKALRAKKITRVDFYMTEDQRLLKELWYLERYKEKRGLTIEKVVQIEQTIADKRKELLAVNAWMEQQLASKSAFTEKDYFGLAVYKANRDADQLSREVEKDRKRMRSKYGHLW